MGGWCVTQINFCWRARDKCSLESSRHGRETTTNEDDTEAVLAPAPLNEMKVVSIMLTMAVVAEAAAGGVQTRWSHIWAHAPNAGLLVAKREGVTIIKAAHKTSTTGERGTIAPVSHGTREYPRQAGVIDELDSGDNKSLAKSLAQRTFAIDIMRAHQRSDARRQLKKVPMAKQTRKKGAANNKSISRAPDSMNTSTSIALVTDAKGNAAALGRRRARLLRRDARATTSNGSSGILSHISRSPATAATVARTSTRNESAGTASMRRTRALKHGKHARMRPTCATKTAQDRQQLLLCRHPEGCSRSASFGEISSEARLFCARHRAPHHEDKKHKACSIPRCFRLGTFRRATGQRVCGAHRDSTSLSIGAVVCSIQACRAEALYALPLYALPEPSYTLPASSSMPLPPLLPPERDPPPTHPPTPPPQSHSPPPHTPTHTTTPTLPTAAAVASLRVRRGRRRTSGKRVRAMWCKAHRPAGSVLVGKRVCSIAGCGQRATHGLVGDVASVCSLHRDHEHVDARHKRCQFKPHVHAEHCVDDTRRVCRRQPSYGDPLEGVARFCAEHRAPTHVDVRRKRCHMAPACVRIASFGEDTGQRLPVSCRAHKLPSHVNVKVKPVTHAAKQVKRSVASAGSDHDAWWWLSRPRRFGGANAALVAESLNTESHSERTCRDQDVLWSNDFATVTIQNEREREREERERARERMSEPPDTCNRYDDNDSNGATSPHACGEVLWSNRFATVTVVEEARAGDVAPEALEEYTRAMSSVKEAGRGREPRGGRGRDGGGGRRGRAKGHLTSSRVEVSSLSE